MYADAFTRHLSRERIAEEVRRAAHESEASRNGGVSWSGMGSEPFRGRSDEQITDAALAAADRAEAFRKSPRGVFLAALREITEISYGEEAEKARAAYYRGFKDDRLPINQAEVAIALLVLDEVPGSDARKARKALCELLIEAHRKAA